MNPSKHSGAVETSTDSKLLRNKSSSKSEEQIDTPKKEKIFVFSGNSSRNESNAGTTNNIKSKTVKQPTIIINSSPIFGQSNGVTPTNDTPAQYKHSPKNKLNSVEKKKPLALSNDNTVTPKSPRNNLKTLSLSSKNSSTGKSNASETLSMKESNWRRRKSDFIGFSGDHTKNIEYIKSMLNSPDLFNFPDDVLSSLVEIHKMTSVASLILENRKVQKQFNLSDEIYLMSLQSSFKLADLKFDTLEPVDHFHIVSYVASYKEHAKYISRKRDRKNIFVCKACSVPLSPQDLEAHFVGGKHQNRIREISKFINYAQSDIPDKILSKFSSARSSSASSQLLNKELQNSYDSSNSTKNLSNYSLIDCKFSEKPVKEPIQLASAESINDILSLFCPIKSASNDTENFCLTCNTKVTGPLSINNINLEQHVNGSKHRSKLAQASTESLNLNTSKTNNSSQNMSNDKASQPSRVLSSSVSSSLSEMYSELMSGIMKKHIKGEVPLNYESDNIGILGFYCDICSNAVKTDVEWLAHLDDFTHKVNVMRAAEKTGVYHCLICKIVIFCPLVTVATSHFHIHSTEHSYIKKLVEKQCPAIAKYVQRHRVLTIKANDLSCNSYCLNVSEEFPLYKDESLNIQSDRTSKYTSTNSVRHPKWSVDNSIQNDRTGRRFDRKHFNNADSDDTSDESSDDDDSDDFSSNEFDDDELDYDSNDDDDVGSDIGEEFERKSSISIESGVKEKDGRIIKKKDKSVKVNNSHGTVQKNVGEGDKPLPPGEQTPVKKKKEAKGRRERPVYSITFTGIDRSVTNDEWLNRFSEGGKLKEISIDYVKGTAVVTYLKRSSMRKVLENKDLIVNKYKLGAQETAKINLDQNCLALFENEHEFENKILSTLNIIDDELNSPEGKLRLACLKERVLHVINFAFPNCEIYEFGSRVSGLATDESDFDLFLDLTGTMYQGTKPAADHQTRLENIKAIRKIATIFRQMPTEFTSIVPITSARVPILKFKHIKTNSQCDLSFKNGLSVENTKLVKKYLNMNAKIRWLVIAVKCWANACGLLSSSHFTTYAVTWLVLFFLMNKKLVPPVGSLMGPKFKNRPPIQGWRCSFDNSDCSREIKDSNVQLLLDFFIFYEFFDFWKFVICTRSGSSIRKFAFREKVASCLPNEIKEDYINCVSKPDRERDFSVSSCSVQDPFDLSHNVTKQVRPVVLRCFQRCCHLAASQIRTWPPFQV